MNQSPIYDGSIAGRLTAYQDLARQEGQQQRPPGTSTSLDQHEALLKSDAEGLLAVNANILSGSLSGITKNIAEIRQQVISAKAECDKELQDDFLAAKVEADLAEHKEQLVEVVKNRMLSESDLNAFRAFHDIREQAVFPESRIHHLAIIGVLALLETIANAAFYENSQGLLGGWMTALGVSSLSMVTAVGLGHAATYKNLRPADEKAKGYLAVAVFLVLLLYLNALFAHFRSEYQLAAETDTAGLGEAFITAARNARGIFFFSLGLRDFLSFILFGVGVILMLFAFWKGYHIDDRCPGHGDRFRRHRQFLDVERGTIATIRAGIAGRIQEKQQSLQTLLNRPAQLAALVASRQSDLSTAENHYRAARESISHDFAMVLMAYRQANVAIRATNPPAYFAESPVLSAYDPSTLVADARGNLAMLSTDVDMFRRDFQAPLQDRLKETMGTGTSLMNARLSAFSEEVMQCAEDRINQSIQVLGRQT